MRLDLRDPTTFPEGGFQIGWDARESLHHAVDSTWISHTFAVTFLVLCYARHIVDGTYFILPRSQIPFR